MCFNVRLGVPFRHKKPFDYHRFLLKLLIGKLLVLEVLGTAGVIVWAVRALLHDVMRG